MKYPIGIHQSGYLTIKAYDRLTGTCLLDFPNNEVKRGFATLIGANFSSKTGTIDGWEER